MCSNKKKNSKDSVGVISGRYDALIRSYATTGIICCCRLGSRPACIRTSAPSTLTRILDRRMRCAGCWTLIGSWTIATIRWTSSLFRRPGLRLPDVPSRPSAWIPVEGNLPWTPSLPGRMDRAAPWTPDSRVAFVWSPLVAPSPVVITPYGSFSYSYCILWLLVSNGN